MLGAVKVLLERHTAAWFHNDALDPIAVGQIDILVVTPRPVDAAVFDRSGL